MPRARKPADKTLRIALWSGPRNISTALMRAFENRHDCAVIDEPFLAHYLAETGADHPGRDNIIESGETDWRKIVTRLSAPIADDKPVVFQKHMAHHLLEHIDHEWIEDLNNVLLIRDPAEVIASYGKNRDELSPEDIGLPQQLELYEELSASAKTPPLVIDACEFLKDPEAQLRALCAALGIDYMECMLHGPANAAVATDPHSPGGEPAAPQLHGFHHHRLPSKRPELTGDAAETAAHCHEYYDPLFAQRLVCSP